MYSEFHFFTTNLISVIVDIEFENFGSWFSFNFLTFYNLFSLQFEWYNQTLKVNIADILSVSSLVGNYSEKSTHSLIPFEFTKSIYFPTCLSLHATARWWMFEMNKIHSTSRKEEVCRSIHENPRFRVSAWIQL